MSAAAAVQPRRSPFRRALELEDLPPRELALCALLDAGLSASETARALRGSFCDNRDGTSFIRLVGGRGTLAEPLHRKRYVPLDDLQRITLERYLAGRRGGAEPTDPLVLNSRGKRHSVRSVAIWIRRRGFVLAGGV